MLQSKEGVRNQENNGGPNHIAAWRKARGFSQKEIAEMLGVTVTHVWLLEHGERKVTAKGLRRLGQVLGVPGGTVLDYGPDDPEPGLLGYWRAASESQRANILAHIQNLLSKPD